MSRSAFVIAEAGVNHNGDVARALALVDAAADAGADAVKFQTFRAESLVTARAARARYQAANMKEDGSQLSMLKKLELARDDHHRLVARCRERGIRFMSTAFDRESLAFLATLDMPFVKVPSGDITAAPLLLSAARVGRPLVVSSGMATLAEIEAALGVVAFGLTRREGLPRSRAECNAAFASAEGQAALGRHVTLLHCTTQYPAPAAAVNLAAMDTMRAAFGLPVGYSDHTIGTEVSIAAVARGAVMIEKHFTLDRTLPGPDHAASLEPDELMAMVRAIRNVEAAIGSPVKIPSAAEEPNRAIARRGVVAARRIAKGQPLGYDDLTVKRPEGAIDPMDIWSLVGRTAARDFDIDDPIET